MTYNVYGGTLILTQSINQFPPSDANDPVVRGVYARLKRGCIPAVFLAFYTFVVPCAERLQNRYTAL